MNIVPFNRVARQADSFGATLANFDLVIWQELRGMNNQVSNHILIRDMLKITAHVLELKRDNRGPFVDTLSDGPPKKISDIFKDFPNLKRDDDHLHKLKPHIRIGTILCDDDLELLGVVAENMGTASHAVIFRESLYLSHLTHFVDNIPNSLGFYTHDQQTGQPTPIFKTLKIGRFATNAEAPKMNNPGHGFI